MPGDNDIGGEHEPIQSDKVKEFEAVFNQPDIITYKNISFFKVNGITYTYPHGTDDDNYKIVVSHYPVLWKTVFGKQVSLFFKYACTLILPNIKLHTFTVN